METIPVTADNNKQNITTSKEKLASPWLRLLARVIDLILVTIFVAILIFVGSIYLSMINPKSTLINENKTSITENSEYADPLEESSLNINSREDTQANAVGFIITLVGIFVIIIGSVGYFVIIDAKGGTLGKRIVKIKVINSDGETVSIPGSLSRQLFMSFIEFFPFGNIVNFIVILARDDKKGLHDMVCKTSVIRTGE